MAKRYGLATRGLSIWIVVAWGVGTQLTTAVAASGSGQSEYAFQVDVPKSRLLAHQDGSSQIEIEGFGTTERRPGAPNLPSKTFLIAIPPGSTPRLEYTHLGALRRFETVPTSVPHRRLDLGRVDSLALSRVDANPIERFKLLRGAAYDVFEPDPAIYAVGTEDQPWVYLGPTGILRHQSYVPVHVRGARWDGRSGQLEVASGFDIRVVFEDYSPMRTTAEIEPVFESVYRSSFLNYRQGRTFRHRGMIGAVVGAQEFSRSGSTPRQKLFVRANGPLRLDYTLMNPTGFVAHNLNTWRLENQGESIPLSTNDDGDGVLEPGEWVQFYGQALDTEPQTVLNTDFANTDIDLFEDRDFTDENVYFLTIDTPGQAAMPEEPAVPQFMPPTPPLMVDASVHEEVDDGFRPLGAADPWYWLPTLAATGPTTTRTETVALPQLHDTTLPLQIRVHLRGVSDVFAIDPDHQTVVTLMNQSNQVLATDAASFDARTLYLHDFGWTFPGAGSAASDPVKLKIETIDIGGGERNDVILDWIEVDYVRSFIADNNRFDFVWPDGDQELLIDGFTNSAVEIWELTATSVKGVVQPVRLTGVLTVSSGPGTFSARFLVDNDPTLADGTPRRFLAFADTTVALPAPLDFPADSVSDLRDPSIQADLIVIGHEDVLDATPGSALDLLLTHRGSVAGGGLSSKVARLEDVQDEFNFGLEGPQAIHEFLRWVVSTAPGEGWAAPKPTYVLLLGDGSFDYKGAEAQGNYLPTQIVYKDVIELGYYASDNLLATVVGADQLPDLVVGRLPARTLGEAAGYLQKILDYETLAPPGAWREHAVTFSDRGKIGNNPGEAVQFELLNQAGLAEIGTQPYTSREVRYWTDFYDAGVMNPEEVMRQEIKDAINGADAFFGAALVQYTGHGNFVVWSDDAFFDERDPLFLDTADLTNGLMLPWLIVQNCLTGGFHIPQFNTMGEDWLRRNGGGAIAVFAPSGLAFNFIGIAVTEDVWHTIFGPEKRRDLAAPVTVALAGLCAQGSIEPCQHYILLGDPATRLQLRSTQPPTGLAATAGNLQVDLTWTASATAAASYIVMRHENLGQPFYINRTPTPIATTQFTDTLVTNGTTYYYHVIAIDPAGFQSSWSNFNSDCGVAGPDCVQATPTNPDPPGVPTGLAVTDPGLGNQLLFSWDANPEADLDFYTISWGPGSNNPVNVAQAAQPTFTATGLTEGQTYCAIVSATNTSGNTSADTTEVCDFAVLAPGVRLPDFIDDLRVSRSGADIVLDWSEVTTDLYGKPAEIVNYEIFRGTAPDYTVSGLTKIGDCAAPCTTFPDPSAAGNGLSQHYRVRAVGADGRSGALGSEAPAGVELQLARGTLSGDILLSWTPATLDLDGNPVDLQHYLVFGSDAPLPQTDVLDGVASPLLTVGGTSVELTPPVQSHFYTVFVVDTRGNISPD